MPVTVLYPADVTLMVGTVQCEAQLSAAILEPAHSDTTVDLLSQTLVVGTKTTRVLRVEGLQDWGKGAASICEFLWANHGKAATFTLKFQTGAMAHGTWAGSVTCREPQSGATAGDGAKFAVQLPCNDRPVFTAGSGLELEEADAELADA
jgi:hypothetical protein